MVAGTASARALATTGEPLVHILMATRNGAAFLQAQLDSFLAQTHRNWALWVSDDGSDDATAAIVRAFIAAHPAHHMTLLQGPQKGAAANFLHLICHPSIPAGLFALSDQDDVWLPGKLERAVHRLAAEPGDPALAYGARTILADEALRPVGTSPLHRRPAGFRNAMIQNILGGNSTVLNERAVLLLRRAGIPEGIHHHDWWIYLMVSAAGGRVIIDPEPVLIYRQHGGNVLGTNAGLMPFLRRLRQVLGREYRDWQRANIRALTRVAPLITAENRATLEGYARAVTRPGPMRALAVWRLGLQRQTALGTGLILLAALIGRL